MPPRISILSRSSLRTSMTPSFWQRRALSSFIQQQNPHVGAIYHELLAEKHMPCNFVSQVVDWWAENPSQLAIRHVHSEENNAIEEIKYGDLVQRSRKIAGFFAAQGFQKGDAVALMLGQNPMWWYSLAGLMRQGIAVVPCSRLLTSKDLSYRINDLRIRGMITIPELQTRVDAIAKECPSLRSLVTTGTANTPWYSLNDIVNEETLLLPNVETTTADPCLYLYTSGTTGQPKAVQHNHDYPFFHWPTGRRWLKVTPEDLVYNASDTGWGFTVWITTAVWSMGGKLLIAPTQKKFDPKTMLTLLDEHPVTIFCAAPTVLRLLVADPVFDHYQLPHLKRIVTVGEALDETVIQRFESRGIEVAVGFGQAETPLLTGRVDEQAHASGSMGKPIAPYRVAILSDDGKPLSPGQTGQIAVDLVHGSRAGLIRCYANAPEKTQQAFSEDGRFYFTGDYATLRSDGTLTYEGRKDDLMKVSGYRIGPNEVEKAGMSHPAVAKIAVVAVPEQSGLLARVIKAFILLKPTYTETPELIKSIQEHIKKETAPYKYPRRVECLDREEWETFETTSGKIRRVGLREREEMRLAEEEDTLMQPTHRPSF